MGKRRQRKMQLKKQARREKQQNNLSLPSKNETSALQIGEIYTLLSNTDYRVFPIILTSQQIGYLGIYRNGRFRHVLTKDTVDDSEVLPFLEHYIRKELHLIPNSIYTK